MSPRIILFVCHGNVFRSVLAERACRQALERSGRAGFEVFSRGLQGMSGVEAPKHRHLREYQDVWAVAEPQLSNAGLSFDGHLATPAALEDIARAAVVIAMDRNVLDGFPYSLVNRFPDHCPRMHLFMDIAGENRDVIDPHGVTDEEIYRRMIREVQDVLNDHLSTLLSWCD